MKRRAKKFGKKLWLSFMLFAAAVFGALWLLQTVLLQGLYDGMAIRNTKRLAGEITELLERDDLEAQLDCLAAEGSALIFLTDWEGNILYSADEHSAVYQKKQGAGWESKSQPENPRHSLPKGYRKFIRQLLESPGESLGYKSLDGSAYTYGRKLPPTQALGPEAVLYMSTPLGAVGAAVGILRIQLIFVTLAALGLGSALAWAMARQFSRPVAAITGQAKDLAAGRYQPSYEAGFCRELDELSQTLESTAFTLEKLENARRELLANVSHDLRTPLTMIKGYAEMVQEISWNDGERRDQDLTVIIRETDRLTALVNDILEYSAAQAQSASLEPVDLSAAVGEAAGQFAPLYQQRGCAVKASIMPGLWALADKKQVQRVLYNLLDNGLRHAKSQLKVSAVRSGGAVRVEVQDDGEGIPPEERELIWERYFTAKQRRGQGGSGLGLAITKELLAAQKARFGVESAQGTMFWFELDAPPQP